MQMIFPGTYTIRVTVTDHVHSAYAKAEEHATRVLRLGFMQDGNATQQLYGV